MNLLEHLESQGVRLWLGTQSLEYEGPKNVLTEETLSLMRQNKAQLVLTLARRKVKEYPPAAIRTSGRPYIGPTTTLLLSQYLTMEEIQLLKEESETGGHS